MPILTHHPETVIGVDTHARTHTFAVLRSITGEVIDTQTFPVSEAGLRRAVSWIVRTGGPDALVAIEGSGSYGANLSRALDRVGVQVAEMDAPVKRHHRSGKSDELDAVDIARRALASPAGKLAQPRSHQGEREILRVLLGARTQLQRARTAAINTLTALLRTHEVSFDARRALTLTQIRQIASWRARSTDDALAQVVRAEAVRLAREILERTALVSRNETQLHHHVRQLAAFLLDQPGIGPVSAAHILAAYSHHGRVRSEAAFARLAGVAPIPASSGNTHRHRLHRGGDRALNSALWRIAFHRYHHDPATINYVTKRTTTGSTRTEILRSLKRYLARSIYRQLQSQTT